MNRIDWLIVGFVCFAAGFVLGGMLSGDLARFNYDPHQRCERYCVDPELHRDAFDGGKMRWSDGGYECRCADLKPSFREDEP